MNASDELQPSGSILIVDIDEKSLAKFGQWPWPRHRLAHLLEKIAEGSAKSIALTMILSEPDRTSPLKWQETIGRKIGDSIDLNKKNQAPSDHDVYLAETLKRYPCVLGYEFLFNAPNFEKSPYRMHPLKVVWVRHPDAPQTTDLFFQATDAVCNLGLFSDSASESGFLNAAPDSDGILRRMPLLIQYENHLYPSLALAALMQFKNISQIQIRISETGSPFLRFEDKIVPIDNKGTIYVNFSNRHIKTLRLSASDVLEGSAGADVFKNRIVLVGSSAAGLEQVYQTPRSPVFSAAEVHSRALETLLSGGFIVRPREFIWWELLTGLILTAGCCFFVTRAGIGWSAAASACIGVGIWLITRIIFQSSGLLFSPFYPTAVILVNYSVLTILKSWRDIVHAKKKAEDALVLLKTSENNLNSIVKAIPDIVFRLDPQGRITFISPAITKYTKHAEDFLGRTVFDFIASEDREKAQYRINERRTGGRATVDLELRLLLSRDQGSADDDIRYFSVSAEGIYKSDRPDQKAFLGTQGIARDITVQKHLKNQLVQAQKLEAIGGLAARVAHDLNNILCGLVSYPDLLLLDLPPDSPLRAKVEIIQQSGEKAAAIVQDLLTLARRGVAVADIFNLNKIIKDYLASPEFDFLQKNHPRVVVNTDLAEDLMDIKGSPVHFYKALMNIMINAAEAMPAGGQIRMRTCNRYLDIPVGAYEIIPEGEYICLEIVDEGVGIAPQDLKRIFEPFYTKKLMQKSRTGLGMTVIWATVKDHHGYIDVSSKEGEGTRVGIYLPATREAAGASSRKKVLEDYTGNEHILVVDDIYEQRDIAVNMLTKLGYQVDSVPSGEAAETFLKTNNVDLVVLDMIMPGGIDGFETYRRLIAMNPGQKAIIASGFSETERVKALQKMGAGTYVQKPYTLEKIGTAVRRELDR